jgi:hypothetical protein
MGLCARSVLNLEDGVQGAQVTALADCRTVDGAGQRGLRAIMCAVRVLN